MNLTGFIMVPPQGIEPRGSIDYGVTARPVSLTVYSGNMGAGIGFEPMTVSL